MIKEIQYESVHAPLKLISAAFKSMPHPKLIDDLEIEQGAKSIRFTYGTYAFRVNEGGFVEEIVGSFLQSNLLSALITERIQERLRA